MSTRSVIVRLEAEVSQYVAGMGRSAAATDDVARRVVNTRRSIADNSAAMKEAGAAAAGMGTALIATLGATAKAAMDWESAWAGVTKTVDGSPQQMDMLESSLRGLAKTLPSTHTEIAAVAEAAGQLGVKRADVVGFTKTMIDLGVSTNLTADEAATNIAQISNVMGTMAREGSLGVSRFGATLVALGNDGASTEKEILAMAQRIAGAAATIGASETDVLALSNTLASMGVRAELGGGVTTRVLLKMYSAVQEGGDKLDAFSKTAGVSAEAFGQAFRDSPIKAMDMVNKGLTRVKNEGGNVVATMKDMGIKGTEETQVMLSLAASGDLLSDSLKLGATAWAENTALVAEAEKRYATTQSKITIAWNNIKDAAIDAGAILLPMISGVAELVSGLAQQFGDLSPAAQSALTIVAGGAGGVLLLGGSLLMLLPRIAATRAAFQTLNVSGGRLPGTLTKVAKGAGIAMGAILLLSLAVKAGAAIWGEKALDVGQFSQALLTAGDNATALNATFKQNSSAVVEGIDGIGDAVNRMGDFNWYDNLANGFNDMVGITSKTTKIRDSMKALDSTLADLATSGNFKEVGAKFATVYEEAKKSAEADGKKAMSTRELLDIMPEYEAALNGAATAAGVQLTQEELLNFALGKVPASLAAATQGQDIMKKALEETGVAVNAVIEDMEKFLELLFATGVLTMNSRDANAAYNEALRGVGDTIKSINDAAGAMGAVLNQNATDFDLTTEAGAKANSAFQDIALKGMAEVEAMSKEGVGQDELQAKLTQTGIDLEDAANKFGITGDAATDLAREVLGVPAGVSISSWMDDRAKRMAQETKDAANAADGSVVTITTRFISLYEEKGVPYRDDVNAGGQLRNPLLNNFPKKANGGPITGPGTGTSDDVPIMASNGEHMLTAAEVQAMGGHSAVYRFRTGLRSGTTDALPAYARGGAIGSVMAPARQIAATGGGLTVNFNGDMHALDPVGLRRDIKNDLKYELNGNGVRLV